MASPERRSPSSQRERTPTVQGNPRAEFERHVAAPSSEEQQPSEGCPVFKLPQLLQAASSKSGHPSRSDDVGASAGQPDGTTRAAKKTPSRGVGSSMRKVLPDRKRSVAADKNDVLKSDNDADSDWTTASLGSDQSPLKSGQEARMMSATADTTESATFLEQSSCAGPSAVKRKRLEGTLDTLDHPCVTSDANAGPQANPPIRCSGQGVSERALGLTSEFEAASSHKKQQPFSKTRSPSLLPQVKKKILCEASTESSQSDSDDGSSTLRGKKGLSQRSHFGAPKMEKSPEAGLRAGIPNKSRQRRPGGQMTGLQDEPEMKSQRARDDTGDGNTPSFHSAMSSSKEKEDRDIDLGSRQHEQASAITPPATRSPQGRRRTIIERRSWPVSERDSISEGTAELETPGKHSCVTLSNGEAEPRAYMEPQAASSRDTGSTEQSARSKMHSSSILRNANGMSSGFNEEQVLQSKPGAPMLSEIKRQSTGEVAASMPLGTPSTKAARTVASENAAERGTESAVSRMKQWTGRVSEEDLLDLQHENPLSRSSNENTSTECDTVFMQRAREMTVSEREQTTESEDAESEPRRRSTRLKSSRLRQTPVPKAEPSTKVKPGVSVGEGRFSYSPDNHNTSIRIDRVASQSREMMWHENEWPTEWDDERSNTHVCSARLQSSTPRQTLKEDRLLQAQAASSKPLPGSSSMDIEQATAACSGLTDPSTSRRSLPVASVGKGHATIPGRAQTTEFRRHLTLAGGGEEDTLAKLSQASDNLGGLTQKPRSFSPPASADIASSEEERDDRRSSMRRRSLRRRQEPETVEQFVIDYDEQIPSCSDTDDDNDPPFEVRRRANIDGSAAHFARSVSPFPSLLKEKQTPRKTLPNDYAKSKKPGPATTGRLSLAAIQARSNLSPAITNNVAENVESVPAGVTETLRHTDRYKGDGCQHGKSAERSMHDTTENEHASASVGPASTAATSDTPNAPVLRRSARISGRFSRRRTCYEQTPNAAKSTSARGTKSSAQLASDAKPQVTPVSRRSLQPLNEEVESAAMNKTSHSRFELQFRQAFCKGNLEAAIRNGHSDRSASKEDYSTPGPSSRSLSGDSVAIVTDEQVTPVKVVAERIEDTLVRVQSRCFTCSSCNKSLSEKAPRTRDSETMTDESSFRHEEESPAASVLSKRKKGSDDDTPSPSTSASRRRSSTATRERSESMHHSRRKTATSSQRGPPPTASRQSGTATLAGSTVLRLRSLRATVTAPRRLSYM